ncbi:MAG: electron transport complex subunit RsxC [Planctomycetaceae bacterium]|nr:electron transport complex subunit RsxC [Planctomycetaceae bacterium]
MNAGSWWPWNWTSPNFARGIHPVAHKEATADSPIRFLPTPVRVTLPLQQHAGAAADLVVKPRDKVMWGDLVAKPRDERISAGVHSPVTGVVRPLTAVSLPNGKHASAVVVETEEGTPSGDVIWSALFGGEWPDTRPNDLTKDDILKSISAAGIVGLGGAAFPTHVKLQPAADRPVQTLLVNGCECEPFLTADDRLMREASRAIVAGARLAMIACGARELVIAIEDNKPEAIAAMRSALDGVAAARIVVCPTKYPMGGERQLIPAVFGRSVPTGGYPHDIGIVVVNVGTAAAIAAAVLRNRPLTHRVITVTGGGIRNPGNLLVPLGTSLQDLIDACGGLNDDARRVIAGGPMMGFTVTDLSVPVTKGTGGLTIFTQADLDAEAETACIRCGRCLDVCPLGLMPTRIAQAVRHDQLDLARRLDLEACCECGCCAYECPARVPLVQYLRTGKQAVNDRRHQPQSVASGGGMHHD